MRAVLEFEVNQYDEHRARQEFLANARYAIGTLKVLNLTIIGATNYKNLDVEF